LGASTRAVGEITGGKYVSQSSGLVEVQQVTQFEAMMGVTGIPEEMMCGTSDLSVGQSPAYWPQEEPTSAVTCFAPKPSWNWIIRLRWAMNEGNS